MLNKFLAVLTRAVLMLAALSLARPALAGPVEFGRAELDRAIAARRLSPKLPPIKTEVAVDPPESYRITPGLVTGGDLRGLMYGLLEAADQIRKTGRLQKVEATPGMAVRGARVVIDSFAGDLEWFHNREPWPALFRTLALDRFNRFQIAVPDLAGLVSLPDLEPTGAAVADTDRNLDALHFISDTAAEYGVDFTLGVWMRKAVDGPALYAALVKVLATCPGIRGVQLRMDADAAADAIRAVKETGRRVTIEIPPDSQATAAVVATSGLPIRFSAPYPGVSRPAKGTQFFWELAAPTVAAPDLTRLVSKLAGTGANGFEIDLPPATLGKLPDKAPAYLLLGRLAYDLTEPK